MYAKTCLCLCPSQKLCKHRKAVAHYFNVADFSVLPESDGFAMVKYHNMAHGSCEPAYWYRQFNDNTDVKKLEQLIEKLKTEEEEQKLLTMFIIMTMRLASLPEKQRTYLFFTFLIFKSYTSLLCLKCTTEFYLEMYNRVLPNNAKS